MTALAAPAGAYATAAVALLRSGLGSPLPLPPGRKHPPPAGWTGASGDTASGPDVDQWMQMHPDGNVALRMADGVIGIDVDAYPGKAGASTLAAAQAALGPLPTTFLSTSRNDGVSAIQWFRVPVGTVLVGQLASAGYGRDVEVIQHHHRYAVVAPSVHPAGSIYRWVGPDGSDLYPGEVPSLDDLAPLPRTWLTALSVDAQRAEVSRDIVASPNTWPTAVSTDAYVAKMLDALSSDTPSGDWHSWAFSTCCRLAAAARLGLIAGADLTRGQRTVTSRLQKAAPDRSSDEEPQQEAARCWRDAVERTARMSQEQARNSLGKRDSTLSLANLIAPLEEPNVDAQAREEQQPASWGRIDLTAYLDGTHKPQEPALLRRSDGVALLYAGRVHSFHGESESGKSWAALVAARDVLADGGRVVMLDYESDAATVVSRLLLLGVKRAAIADQFDYRRPEAGPNASSQDAAAWHELLAAPAALAIIDGVTEALATVGRASIDNDEITQWVRDLPRRIAQRTGAAVVLVDHVTKDADGRGRFAIGGQAKMAALDGAAYVVEVVQPLGVGLRGSLALRVGKDRPGMVRPHAGTWRKSDRTQEAAVLTIDSTQPGTTTAALDPPRSEIKDAIAPKEPFRPTTLMQRVSQVAQNAPEPLSRSALATRAGGNRTYALQAIDILLNEGHLASDGPAKNGHPTIRSVRPYSGLDVLLDFRNGSTAPEGHDPSATSSRSRDRGPGTGLRNGSNPFRGTSGNESGTSRSDVPADTPHCPADEHRGDDVA